MADSSRRSRAPGAEPAKTTASSHGDDFDTPHVDLLLRRLLREPSDTRTFPMPGSTDAGGGAFANQLPAELDAVLRTFDTSRMSASTLALVIERQLHETDGCLASPPFDDAGSKVLGRPERTNPPETTEKIPPTDQYFSYTAPVAEDLRQKIASISAELLALPEEQAHLVISDIQEILKHAKGEVCEEPSETPGPPLPKLSPEQVRAVVARGGARPWSKHKREYRGRVFAFVRDTYGEWIPGLLQSHLKTADPRLHAAFAAQLHRDGVLPSWLDVPSRNDAALRRLTDPNERQKLLAARRALRPAGAARYRILKGARPAG
jgi:hypothetical protein